MKQTGPWVIPPEVQAAAEAVLPAAPAMAGEKGTATGSPEVQVPAPSEPPAGVDAALAAEDEDEEEDEETRRNTKVYKFVDGKLVEEESGEEAPLIAATPESAGLAEPGQEVAGSVSIPAPEPQDSEHPAGESSGPSEAAAGGAASSPEAEPPAAKQPADDGAGQSLAEKDDSTWQPEPPSQAEPEA
jgi:hypothetical protein